MIKFESLIKPSDNSMSIKIIWKMKKDSLGVKDRSISSSVSRDLDSNVIQLQVSLILCGSRKLRFVRTGDF